MIVAVVSSQLTAADKRGFHPDQNSAPDSLALTSSDYSGPRFIRVHLRPIPSSHIGLNHSRYPTSGARTSLNPKICTCDSQGKSVFSCGLVLIDRGGTLIAKSI